ncbi:hypothetical protein ABZ307_40845 [Streptomyces griseorubiginosus]|uniref:hypothetical protein n=1 Tax=Streptomyces griseorubiginosus TaxID=67304 RepID=UPI0033A0BF9A
MSSSVIIDWERLAAEERARCLRLQQEFIEVRAHARTLDRRCAVTEAVTGARIAVPLVVMPEIEEGSGVMAEQLQSVRRHLTAVEEQLDAAARGFTREQAAVRPTRQGVPSPAARSRTTAAGDLAAWRAKEDERRRTETAAAERRTRAEAAERTAATVLARAAELTEALPDRAEEVRRAAQAVLAGEPGAEDGFARLVATGREATRAAREREEATLLRERIALLTERVATASHPKAGAYAETLRRRESDCRDDTVRLAELLDLAQEVLGRLTAAESRAELIAAVHGAMGEAWSLTDASVSAPVTTTTAAAEEATSVLVPLPGTFPHHAVRFGLDDVDALTAEVVRLPGGDPAADRAAQQQMCAGMDELTARLAARGFATVWREQAPAGAFAAMSATAHTADAAEASRREEAEAAEVSRARQAARQAPRQASAQRDDRTRGGR